MDSSRVLWATSMRRSRKCKLKCVTFGRSLALTVHRNPVSFNRTFITRGDACFEHESIALLRWQCQPSTGLFDRRQRKMSRAATELFFGLVVPTLGGWLSLLRLCITVGVVSWIEWPHAPSHNSPSLVCRRFGPSECICTPAGVCGRGDSRVRSIILI